MFARTTWSIQVTNSVRLEYEDVAPMGARKVVAELVDKNLVPEVRISTQDRLSLLILLTKHRTSFVERRQYTELLQLIRCDPDRISPSRSHLDQGAIPQPPQFHGVDLGDAVVILLRHHIGIGASLNHKLKSLHQEVRSRTIDGLGNDAIQRRLHRSGRNFERLQIIRS